MKSFIDTIAIKDEVVCKHCEQLEAEIRELSSKLNREIENADFWMREAEAAGRALP